MSTKVYNLYRYTGGDVLHLLAWLKHLRVEYVKYIQKTLRQYAPHQQERKSEIDSEKLLAYIERDTKAGYRSPFNIDASACIYLLDGQIYVHFFADQVFLNEYIESKTVLVDCHYQNQSDRPDDVSDEQWDERRKLVESIGIDVQPPARAGMIWVLADGHDAISLVREL